MGHLGRMTRRLRSMLWRWARSLSAMTAPFAASPIFGLRIGRRISEDGVPGLIVLSGVRGVDSDVAAPLKPTEVLNGPPRPGMRPTHLILPHLARFARSDMGHPFTRRTGQSKVRSGPPQPWHSALNAVLAVYSICRKRRLPWPRTHCISKGVSKGITQ